MVDSGLLERVLYARAPDRYEYRLTQKGLDLYPVVMAIVHWGDVHMSGETGRRVGVLACPCRRIHDQSLQIPEC